jgi:predicted nucleic acid-binding protein
VIVLDAAALVDVLTDQPAGAWVLDRLEGTPICAPGHLPAEVLSAIARLARAGVLDERAARDALVEAAGLEQELVAVTGDLVLRAYDLSGHIRVLDGLYVALAEARGVPLVTTDRRLARAQLPVEIEVPVGA